MDRREQDDRGREAERLDTEPIGDGVRAGHREEDECDQQRVAGAGPPEGAVAKPDDRCDAAGRRRQDAESQPWDGQRCSERPRADQEARRKEHARRKRDPARAPDSPIGGRRVECRQDAQQQRDHDEWPGDGQEGDPPSSSVRRFAVRAQQASDDEAPWPEEEERQPERRQPEDGQAEDRQQGDRQDGLA